MNQVQPDEDVYRLAEHLFREESTRIIASLTYIFGPTRLQLAEDVAQEALLRALKTWPYYGVPANPAAWLTQTAKNLALDTVRRETNFQQKASAISAHVEQRFASNTAAARFPALAGEITDDTLRLIFTCCHPELPSEGQTAIALKTLCGFSPAQIAQAFLTTEAAILKRLTRTRQRIRELHIPFEIPSDEQLELRIQGVLQTLYLLFNEGYKSTDGPNLIRRSLCYEAIRLTNILANHRLAGQPQIHALLALMLFNAARLDSRTTPDGNLLLLRHQDRSTWDQQMIASGFAHLETSATGRTLTPYHIQAAIAACHCAAKDYESTDWTQILQWYDVLTTMDRSPIVGLNRAVAVAQIHGPEAALEAVGQLTRAPVLEKYYLYHALLGHIHQQLGNTSISRTHYAKAAALATTPAEQHYLNSQL